MNQKPTALDYIVVITKAVLAAICVVAICCAMFFKNYSDPATLSALFLLTGTLVGNLRGSMSFHNPFAKPDEPIPTEIQQPPGKPVPVVAEPPQPENT
jgi:hypothetical protein